MGTRPRAPDETPEARLDFARRLRELRIPRGYRTARSLARALEIDENRYTRYERAEVEPDLDMSRRICALLDVTPNDLLTAASTEGESADRHQFPAQPVRWPASPGFANPNGGPIGFREGATAANFPVATAAWHLAELVGLTELAARHTSKAEPQASPLLAVKRTGELYTDLMHNPFAGIAAILADPVVCNAPAELAIAIKESIDTLISMVKSKS